jgi:LCP family protein required for cell wall assembly
MRPVRSVPMIRRPVSVLLVALIVAACAPAATVTTTSPTTTHAVSASTTTVVATTTTVPRVDMSIAGAPGPLIALIHRVYLGVHTATPIDVDLPAGLADALAGLEPGGGVLDVQGRAALVTVLGTRIAVVRAGDDVVLAVADPTWRIVGMKPARFGLPAFYGDEPKFLLVVGSDARPGEDPLRSRADSLHIVAMRPSTGQGAIVGIPRDSYVTTPDGLTDKFTHILSRRGPDDLLATARSVTSLPIEGYVLTGFAGFTSLVDAFGGFMLDVPVEMADAASQAYFQPGDQHVDGTSALAFSRNRHLRGGDFTRSGDQGLVMIAALGAVQTLGYDQLPGLLGMLAGYSSTDLDAARLLTTAASAYELNVSATPNVVADGIPDTVNGASIVRLTDDAFVTFADLSDGTLDTP